MPSPHANNNQRAADYTSAYDGVTGILWAIGTACIREAAGEFMYNKGTGFVNQWLGYYLKPNGLITYMFTFDA